MGKATKQSDYMMGVSSRLDVAIKCTARARLRVDSTVVVTFEMSPGDEEPTNASPFVDGKTWQSTRPPYLQDLRSSDVASHWDIKLDETNINKQQYSPTKPLCVNGHDLAYGT